MDQVVVEAGEAKHEIQFGFGVELGELIKK